MAKLRKTFIFMSWITCIEIVFTPYSVISVLEDFIHGGRHLNNCPESHAIMPFHCRGLLTDHVE